MNKLQKFFKQKNISMWSTFESVIFDRITQEVPVPKLTKNILTEYTTDQELIKKYNCKNLTPDEIASTIKYIIEQGDEYKDTLNIVGYVDFNGEQYSVYLFWYSDGRVWNLGAIDLNDDWDDGSCFLSRNELETFEPLKTDTLPSVPLSEQIKTLETQVEKLKNGLRELLASVE